MKLEETKYSNSLFKTCQKFTDFFCSTTGRQGTFLVEENTIVLILEDAVSLSFDERPCVKILVLSGIHSGKVGYEYVYMIQNSYYTNYKKVEL